MKSGGSMPHPKGLSNNLYPEPKQPHTSIKFIIIIIIIISIIIIKLHSTT